MSQVLHFSKCQMPGQQGQNEGEAGKGEHQLKGDTLGASSPRPGSRHTGQRKRRHSVGS